MAQLPSWRAIGGISAGLLPATGPRGAERPPPSLEECLLAVWPGPFGWMLVAEPLSAAEIRDLADGLAEREHLSAGPSDRFPERALELRRLSLRHAEIRTGASAGLWRGRAPAAPGPPPARPPGAALACVPAGPAVAPARPAPPAGRGP